MLFVRKVTHTKYLSALILWQKKLDKSMLPLHTIVMDIFDTVEGKLHQCVMDNIYNSSAFFKAGYNHDKNY